MHMNYLCALTCRKTSKKDKTAQNKQIKAADTHVFVK